MPEASRGGGIARGRTLPVPGLRRVPRPRPFGTGIGRPRYMWSGRGAPDRPSPIPPSGFEWMTANFPIVAHLRGLGWHFSSRLPATFKNASWVESLVLRRPLAAEVRLGWTPIGPLPAVQGASHPVFPEVTAGR